MTQQNPRTLPGPPLAWGLLAVALLLRFYHLGHQSIWTDEYTSYLCAIPFDHMTFGDLWENLHGPLHAVVIHAVVRWLGTNAVTLRLPTAVAGVMMVGVMYRVAERMLGRGGIVAAALSTFSPFLIWYSQEARNYAFVMLFAAGATWAWVEILQTRRAAWWVAYVLACVAGILSNLSMLFVIAAHFVHWAWLRQRERRAFRAVRPWMFYVLLVVLCVSPWLWQLSQAVDWRILYRHVPASDNLERATGMTWLAIPYTLYTFCLGYSMGPSPRELHGTRSLPVFLPHLWWLALGAILFGFLTVRGLLALRRQRNANALILAWIAVPMLLTLWLTLRDVKVFNPRYVAVSLPAFYLIWVEAFLSMRSRWRRWGAAAVLACFWGAALVNYYGNPVYDKDHIREAGRYVAIHWKPKDFLLTAGSAQAIHFYISRYYPTAHFWLGYARDPARLAGKFEAVLPDTCDRIWVVTCRPHWYDPADNFSRFLESHYGLLDRRRELGCEIYLVPNPRARAAGGAGVTPKGAP